MSSHVPLEQVRPRAPWGLPQGGFQSGGLQGDEETKKQPLLIDAHRLPEPQNGSRLVYCALASKYK